MENIYIQSLGFWGEMEEPDMHPGDLLDMAGECIVDHCHPDEYFNIYDVLPVHSGNIDDMGGFDYDDIDNFVDLLNDKLPLGMTMARMMEIVQAAQTSVPEPTGLALSLAVCFFLIPSRRLRRYSL